jgi:4'-phosphopantetheinyl transferase
MPLVRIDHTDNRAWALWRVEEDEESLAAKVLPFEKLPDTISNPIKRLEWLAGRILVKLLMEKLDQSFQGVTKNSYGKPFPIGSSYQLALSHSYPYVTALIDKHIPVGIDLEQPKAKLLKIAPRVLSSDELADAGTNVVKHCVYWCAKESLIKVYGKKDLTLAQNIKISPFELAEGGNIVGQIIVDSIETKVSLQYSVTENFVVVWSLN